MLSKIASCIVLLAALLAGCASSGKPFELAGRDRLVLGATTRQNAVQIFGSPLQTETGSGTTGNYEIHKYVYSRAWGYPGGAVAPVRVLFLEFNGDALNAFVSSSSFPEDRTNFDVAAASRIQSGTTTKAQVLELLGKPSGEARCPSNLGDFSAACASCSEVWKWVYTWDAGRTMESKQVSVGFDASGVVTSVRTQN